MTTLTQSPAWKSLSAHRREIDTLQMRDLFRQDAGRFERFSLRFDDLLFDYSKNRITQKTMQLLVALAEQSGLSDHIEQMFSGAKINFTEQRAVLHTALRNRSKDPITVDGRDVMPAVNAVLERMRRLVQSVQSGEWTGHTGKSITEINGLIRYFKDRRSNARTRGQS